MSKFTFENMSYWESASKYILSFPEIRFIGVVNNMGNLVVGDYKKGIVPIADADHYKICIEHAMDMFMKKDLDDTLGPLEYTVSKRKNVKIIAIPVRDYLVLVSAEPHAKIEPIKEDILEALGDMQQDRKIKLHEHVN